MLPGEHRQNQRFASMFADTYRHFGVQPSSQGTSKDRSARFNIYPRSCNPIRWKAEGSVFRNVWGWLRTGQTSAFASADFCLTGAMRFIRLIWKLMVFPHLSSTSPGTQYTHNMSFTPDLSDGTAPSKTLWLSQVTWWIWDHIFLLGTGSVYMARFERFAEDKQVAEWRQQQQAEWDRLSTTVCQ